MMKISLLVAVPTSLSDDVPNEVILIDLVALIKLYKSQAATHPWKRDGV